MKLTDEHRQAVVAVGDWITNSRKQNPHLEPDDPIHQPETFQVTTQLSFRPGLGVLLSNLTNRRMLVGALLTCRVVPKAKYWSLTDEGWKLYRRLKKGATAKQKEVLAWMVKHNWHHGSRVGRKGTFSGGSLINFYAERAAWDNEQWEQHQEAGGTRETWKPAGTSYGRGGYASHGWRRAGGTVLVNLAKAGFVEEVYMEYGVPHYAMTDAGAEVGKETLDKEPPVWFDGPTQSAAN